jgi:hypothetical protein
LSRRRRDIQITVGSRHRKLYPAADSPARRDFHAQTDGRRAMTERAKRRWMLAAKVALGLMIVAATVLTWLPAIVARR